VEDEIRVFSVRLDEPSDWARICRQLLPAEELTRADRFIIQELTAPYPGAHAALRIMLGRCLGQAPKSLTFRTHDGGKPALAGDRVALEFNLSHSGDLVAIAVAWGCPVGVDVEQERPLSGMQEIARRFFGPHEHDQLLHLKAQARLAAFYRCWTRKEAYIKAVGGGLAIPLDSFRVSLRPGEPARFLEIDGSTEAAASWSLVDFTPMAGYAGAVAFAGRRVVRLEPVVELSALLRSAVA
jgi:4'-phosphopantetheinyl transferase